MSVHTFLDVITIDQTGIVESDNSDDTGLKPMTPDPGRIKALLLRHENDYCGACFGATSAANSAGYCCGRNRRKRGRNRIEERRNRKMVPIAAPWAQ